MIIHPAFTIPFDQLIYGLRHEVNNLNVNTRTSGDLTQWTYTQQCTYDANWNIFTQVARGLITNKERIVAVPFPKFFNLTENKTVIPNLPFECFEKVDGSLIIVYHYDGAWRTATKGSFNSSQALWTHAFLIRNRLTLNLNTGYTYLFEAIYPENKIVVSYPKEDLVLLGVYDIHTGQEMNSLWKKALAKPFSQAKIYSFNDLNSIIERSSTLPSSEEGFVIRYEDGTRVKIKGDEYCRIHRLISNITPLAIWEMMMKGDDLEFVRRELPEEFLIDFDNIIGILLGKFGSILMKCLLEMKRYFELTDKELGLILDTLEPDVRKLIFPIRKNKGELTSKTRDTLYRMIRPTANKLEGYIPSSSMNRVQEDE